MNGAAPWLQNTFYAVLIFSFALAIIERAIRMRIRWKASKRAKLRKRALELESGQKGDGGQQKDA